MTPLIGRLRSGILLVGALLLLVSLYLPWREGAVGGRFGELFGTQSFDGWSSQLGDALAVAAIALTAAAAGAVARPALVRRLPLAEMALLTGYLGLAALRQLRTIAGAPYDSEFGWTAGAYLAFGAAVLVLAAATTLVARPRPPALPATAIGVALLVAYLLPWRSAETAGVHFEVLGVAAPAAVVAAVVAVRLIASGRVGGRVAAAAAVFTAAAFFTWPEEFFGDRAYGSWVALALAVALAAIGLLRGVGDQWPAPVPLAAAAAAFVVALFLPWARVCSGEEGCYSLSAWTHTSGTGSGGLAVLLLLVALPEVAAGIAILVATIGFEIAESAGFAYGAIVGFAAAAAIVALAFRQVRLPPLARTAPIVICTGFVALVALPWWDVLPHAVQDVVAFVPQSWLTIAGAMLAVWLAALWARGGDTRLLVAIPLAMLALAALDVVRIRHHLTWGAGLVVGLCVLLAALGAQEQRGGLRIPEILRIDRIRA